MTRVSLAAAVALGLAGVARADVLPPEPVLDPGLRVALVFGVAYALTVLCEFLVVRAVLLRSLRWTGPGRGGLLETVAEVNLLTLAGVWAVILVLGPRGLPDLLLIGVAEAIPFLLEPWLYALRLRLWVKAGRLEAVPPRALLWQATLLGNVVSLAAGATAVFGVSAFTD